MIFHQLTVQQLRILSVRRSPVGVSGDWVWVQFQIVSDLWKTLALLLPVLIVINLLMHYLYFLLDQLLLSIKQSQPAE